MTTRQGGPAYRWVDAALLRASAHLGDVVPAWFPDLRSPDPGGDGRDQAAAAAQWAEWLAQVWAQDAVVAAVRVASPVLADRVTAVCRSGSRTDLRRTRRLAFAVARYLVRMRGRATPFGLFAGVAPLRFGEAATARWADDHRVRVRPDASWLADVLDDLEGCPRVQKRVSVVRSDLATARGDRVVVPAASGAAGVATSLRYTRALRLVMELTDTPVVVSVLIEQVAAAFPDQKLPAIEAMVGSLIRAGLLITCLRPPATVTDPLAHVAHRLDELGVTGMSAAAAGLAELNRMISRETSGGPDTGLATDLPLTVDGGATARSAVGDDPARWAVDLGLAGEFTVPEAVAREAETAADALLRLSAAPHGHPGWREYHARFLVRYGAGAVVGLDQLLDPTTGLGLPRQFARDDHERPLSHRDKRLLELAQQAALDGATEVILDDTGLAALDVAIGLDSAGADGRGPGAGPVGGAVRRVPHMELSCEVRAPTLGSLTAGRFALVVTGIGRTGVATSGRFLDLLPESDQRRAVAALRALPVAVDTAVTAQLSFTPSPARVANVARVGPVFPEVLAVGEYHSPTDGRMRTGDLSVTADRDRMYLISRETGDVIEPTLVSAVARHTMPHAVRLLAELPRATSAAVSLFHWGAADALPFRPRLRYGRSVLTAARWRVSPDALPGPAASHSGWRAELDAVRHRLRLPGTVSVGTGDRRLRLDLDQAMDSALLRAHIDHARGPVTLAEAATSTDHGWLGGRAHELVIPLASTATPAPPPARAGRGRPRVVIDRQHGELPGSGVLSARLACPLDAMEQILTRHLPRLLADPDAIRRDGAGAPRWWFLRFRSPVPHLRLRLHVDNYGLAADRTGRWAADLRRRGLTGDLVLDTYRPELARYTDDGAPAAMAAAEEVFAADSAAARAQLVTTAQRPDVDPIALTAASMLDLASSLARGRRRGAAWLVEQPDDTTHLATSGPDLGAGRTGLRDRALLVQVHALSGVAGATATSQLGEHAAVVTESWAARRRAVTRYLDCMTPDGSAPRAGIVASLLHLHHVRALGPDPHCEARCNHLARSTALAVLTREPDRGDPT